jgi:BASS family bile acid:Na+ symporter
LTFQQFAESTLIPLQLVLAMFGMGTTLAPRDFLHIARDPRGLVLGLALQVVLVPLLAAGLASALGLGPGWTVGLILIAAMPGAALSNLLTHLGRGSTALSIAVSTASTAGCLVTIPLLLELLAKRHLPDRFIVPTSHIVRDILVFLLLPLLVGMVVNAVAAARAPLLSRWSVRGSLALVLVITASSLGSGRIKVFEYGWAPVAVLYLFILVLALVPPQLCRLLGRRDPDTLALSVQVLMRNMGIALLLVRFFFPDRPEQGHILYSCLLYAGTAGPIAIPMVLAHRRGSSPVLLRQRAP